MKRFQALLLFAAFVLVTGCGTAQVGPNLSFLPSVRSVNT